MIVKKPQPIQFPSKALLLGWLDLNFEIKVWTFIGLYRKPDDKSLTNRYNYNSETYTNNYELPVVNVKKHPELLWKHQIQFYSKY